MSVKSYCNVVTTFYARRAKEGVNDTRVPRIENEVEELVPNMPAIV
jgi:hypothetical protein